MPEKKEKKVSSSVDKGLVAMFLRMSPEERLRANDNAIRTILELRRGLRQQQAKRDRQRLPVLEEKKHENVA